MSSLHRGFQQGAEVVDSDAPFAWLDRADASPLIQGIKQRMLELCPVRTGDRVLDVGCGLGHELQRLANRAGPQGHLVGIDSSQAMVAEARRRAGRLGMSIAFEVGDAHALGFPDEHFDLCRVERVLRYLECPEKAVGDMVRVVRRGGLVVAFDFDSDQTIVDAPDAALTRRIAEVLDDAVPHPWVGRQLLRLFRRSGLADVQVIAHAICLTGQRGFGMYQQLNQGTIDAATQAGRLTADEAAAWREALAQAARAETFLAANVGFIAIGHRP